LVQELSILCIDKQTEETVSAGDHWSYKMDKQI
jgi:hypothetical protein